MNHREHVLHLLEDNRATLQRINTELLTATNPSRLNTLLDSKNDYEEKIKSNKRILLDWYGVVISD